MSKVRVLNPVNQTDVFCIVPALTLARKQNSPIITQRAPVHLVVGRHIGPNSGFGVKHIWAEHQNEIIRDGFATEAHVPAYVQRILSIPSVIYFEDRAINRTRIRTVRIVTGTVILEYVRTILNGVEQPHWSVVTAYSDTKPTGVLVGQIS